MSNTTSAKGRRTRPPRRDAARTPVPTAHGSAVGFWMVASGFAIIVGFSAVPTPLYGLYAARDGFGPLMITVVYATYVVGVAAGLLGAGHISDWYGRRRVLIPALATAAISAVLFLVWRDLPGLMVARLVGGLAVGVTGSTATVELPSPSLWLFLCGGALIGIGGGTYFRSALTGALALSDRSSRAGTLASVYLASYVGQAAPVVGLGVLMQNIAAGTSLLIFGVLLIAGVAASARSMIQGHAGSGPQRAPAGKGK